MDATIHKGIPHNGKFIFADKEQFIAALLAGDGRDSELVLRDVQKPNTLSEQRYYRKVVLGYIAEQMGETNMDEVHRIVADMFFREPIIVNGEEFMITRSTAIGQWTTTEWEAKMTEIRNWYREFFNGKEIPLPGETDF